MKTINDPSEGKNRNPFLYRFIVEEDQVYVVTKLEDGSWAAIVFCQTEDEVKRQEYYVNLRNRQNPTEQQVIKLLPDPTLHAGIHQRIYFKYITDAMSAIKALESQDQQR